MTNTTAPSIDKFLCPITQQLMREPVVASDGQTYEREAIEQVIASTKTSPFSRKPLSDVVHDNLYVKNEIDELVTKYPILQKELYVPANWTKNLFEAMEGGKVEVIKTLLKKEPTLVDKQHNNVSFLVQVFKFAKKDDIGDLLPLLGEKGATKSKVTSGKGSSPFYYGLIRPDAVEVMPKIITHFQISDTDVKNLLPIAKRHVANISVACKNIIADAPSDETRLFEIYASCGVSWASLVLNNVLITWYACEPNRMQILNFLISKNWVDKDKLFSMCAQKGKLFAMRLFSDTQIDLELRPFENMTPLHHAILNEQIEVIQFLVENGANEQALYKGVKAYNLKEKKFKEKILETSFLRSKKEKQMILELGKKVAALETQLATMMHEKNEKK